jgi:hypothetical protein
VPRRAGRRRGRRARVRRAFELHGHRGGELPPGGWDRVLLWAFRDHENGTRTDTVSALEIAVRSNEKHRDPHEPSTAYIARTRDDGLPVDAWLRTHVRAGATIHGVAPRSMVVAGSLGQWREWTGLPFDTTGEVVVPLALVPVVCDVAHDYAVYVEPNVWVRHRL